MEQLLSPSSMLFNPSSNVPFGSRHLHNYAKFIRFARGGLPRYFGQVVGKSGRFGRRWLNWVARRSGFLAWLECVVRGFLTPHTLVPIVLGSPDPARWRLHEETFGPRSRPGRETCAEKRWQGLQTCAEQVESFPCNEPLRSRSMASPKA
jgi:hypothetical protein